MRRWLHLGASATVAALLAWPAHVGVWTRLGGVVWFCVMLEGAYWLGRREALRQVEAQAEAGASAWGREIRALRLEERARERARELQALRLGFRGGRDWSR